MRKIITFAIVVFSLSVCNAQQFQNSSLEIWGADLVCEVNLSPDSWINYSNVGSGPDEGDFLHCPSTIPPHASHGHVYARMMAGTPIQGEGMYQLVSGFVPGIVYRISFDYAGSNLWGGSGDIIWHLFIDDIDVSQTPVYHSSDTLWTTHSFNFTASVTTHKIGVRAYASSNITGSAGIDNFSIDQVVSVTDPVAAIPFSIYPNPFRDQLIVNTETADVAELCILDVTSRRILKEYFSQSVSLQTVNLPAGIYIYEIRINSRFFKNGLLMKY